MRLKVWDKGQGLRRSHLSAEGDSVGQEAITWIRGGTETKCEDGVRWGEEWRSGGGGLIVRKMNGERETGDTSGQTLMDFYTAGSGSHMGSDWGLAATGNSVITHKYTHTTHSLPICLLLCLALTQYYRSHRSSRVILLRGTNWTLSLHDCLGTQFIFYPSSRQRVREREKPRQRRKESICSLLVFRICLFKSRKQTYYRS